MTEKDALKILEISSNLTAETIHTRAMTDGNCPTKSEVKEMFYVCVDMVYDKFKALPTVEDEVNEKFVTIAEMHKVFADKFAEYDAKSEKFTTIAEMHKIFADKFAEYDKRLPPRSSRRPI